jgi:hypothetical protein
MLPTLSLPPQPPSNYTVPNTYIPEHGDMHQSRPSEGGWPQEQAPRPQIDMYKSQQAYTLEQDLVPSRVDLFDPQSA